MFIIQPKAHAQRPALTASPPHAVHAVTPPANAGGSEREPTRAAAACDSCRGKKIKCNGQRPCAKCQQKGIVCAYSRPAHRETHVSASQVALLRSQQRRLGAALQRMASTIARYEEGVERSPDSFDIPQLLDKFAPEARNAEALHPEAFHPEARHPDALHPDALHPDALHPDALHAQALDQRRSASAKRPAEYQLAPDPSSTRAPRLDPSAASTTPRLVSSTYGRVNPVDLPFELQPAPNNWSASPEQWNEQYQTMMHFLQTYGGASAGTPVSPMGGAGIQPAPGAVATNSAQRPAESTQQLMQLIDWNSSLQNLQASFTPAPPSDPSQFLDPALSGTNDDTGTNIDPQLGNGVA